MKRSILIFLLLWLSQPQTGHTQSYGTTLGLRFGNSQTRTVGLTLKQRILKKTTLEGIAQTDFIRNSALHVSLQRHHSVLTKRVNIYVGAGLSVSNEESEIGFQKNNEVKNRFDNTALGADVILGIEFTLLRYNFSLDYKPNFNLVGREHWFQGQIGFSVRSVIVKGSTQNKRKRKRAKRRKKKERQKENDDKEKNFWEKFKKH